MGYRTTKSKIEVESNKTDNYTDFYYYFFRNILLVSIPLVIISVVVLSSLHISATGSGSSTDTLSFSISSSCTLSSVVDSSHTAELINGTYVDGIGQTTITTLCNDGNGYSIYANGYSNNEEGNNKLVNTDSPNFNIVSGTAESGNTSNWAMSLNNLKDDSSLTPPTITSDYDSIYGIVPDKWTKVASLPAKATDMIKGSSFTTTYAVYTSSSQYAGTYNGQVKYMLVHPNNNKPTLTNLEAAFASHGIQPAYQDETGSYFAMQDMSTEICNSVSGDGETTATQLVDARDNKLYWVAKLKDGHCWMTQNLDTDISANATLNSQTTDLNEYNVAGYYDGYAKSGNIIYWEPANTTINFDGTTMTGWHDSDTIPYSASKTDDAGTEYSSLGNWYNWTAAIASNNSSSLTQDTLNDIVNNPKNSICPKGWRLPTISSQSEAVSGSTNEFARLNNLYNNNSTSDSYNLTILPLYFVKPGFIDKGGLYENSNYGGYWSSTLNNTGAYYLRFRNNVSPSNYYYARTNGLSIRCLARTED